MNFIGRIKMLSLVRLAAAAPLARSRLNTTQPFNGPMSKTEASIESAL
jgi:hypothetical protein